MTENRISISELKDLLEKENIKAEIFCPDEDLTHKFTYLSYNSSDVTDDTNQRTAVCHITPMEVD